MIKDVLQSYSVLYVEDDVGVRQHFVTLLERYFKHVYEAGDGIEALALYESEPIDVLIADIDLPKMDGLSLVSLIREEDESLPIVMLTAHSEKEKLHKATELYLVKYLLKPVEPKEFREVLQKIAKKLSVKEKDIVLDNGYIWSVKKNQIHHKGKEIVLSPKEEKLLQLFIANRGACVGFGEIMLEVWGDNTEASISMETIKYHVSKLRTKLTGLTIRNIYAEGYILA